MQNQPEGVDVGAVIDRLGPCLLRCHVLDRADNGADDRVLLGQQQPQVLVRGRRRDGELRAGGRSRNPEVHDQGLAGLGDHDVGGLQVAMDDTCLVRGGQPRRDLACDRRDPGRGQLSLRLEDRRQIVPLEVRHRDVLDAVHLSHVVDADDVPVRDFPGEQQFLLEPSLEGACGLRIGGNLRAHRLERDCDPQILVECLVDGPHAAGTEKPQDAVPASEGSPHEIVRRGAGRGRACGLRQGSGFPSTVGIGIECKVGRGRPVLAGRRISAWVRRVGVPLWPV